jgi:hypothetical protein
MKRYLKIALLSPIILIWDIYYFFIEKLYRGSKIIDEEGGKLIEDFIDKE